MTSVSDPLVGQVLDGRYEILSRLARGGMATVYRATDLRLTRTVAVKVMHEGLGDDSDFVKKFDREARAAATLSSPHVVSVFDQGMDHGRPYIVMEFVDGSTLRHVVSREAPMEPLRALDLVESVVNALAAAHDAGLVHRDVKPENVLISSRGQVKVADFGLARAVSAQTATATQGLLIGTVSYLPPELVTKARADARGDVYSTGVVLFEMLTGQKPHQAETPIAVAWSHVHNDIPAPSTLLARATDSSRIIPPYLDALVVACTRRQPAERPRDARELLALVRQARRALRKGILDDPALTSAMLESTRHRHRPQEATVPDPERHRTLPEPAPDEHTVMTQLTAQPGNHATAQPAGGERVRAHEPTGDVDFSAPGHGPDYRIDLADEDSDFPVPRVPATTWHRSPARPPRPRSPRTPVFPHLSHDPVHRRRRGLVALIAVLVLALVLGLSAYFYLAKLRWTSAPTLSGTTQAQAEQIATGDGFTVTTSQAYSESIPKGAVVQTDPRAGDRVLKGSQIQLIVSKGPERHAMPKVTGLELPAARAALTGAKLTQGAVTTTWHESVPSGRVIAAGYEPGTSLKPSTKVDLTVSKGRAPITIDSYVGKTEQEARNGLTGAGFRVASSERNSQDVPKGSVVSQTPASGTGHRNDTVTLVISKGPEMVQVPGVAGVDEATAKGRLEGSGFKVKVNYTTSSWLRLNVVAAQTPAAGKQAPKGSTVTIFVS